MNEKKINVENSDNEYLEALVGPAHVIGHVDAVNGAGAEEMPSFIPTRHELEQLVKHWATEKVDAEYFYFCYRQTGSREIRVKPYAVRRIDRIAQLLGVERTREVVEEAIEEYGRNQDRRLWEIFRHGHERAMG